MTDEDETVRLIEVTSERISEANAELLEGNAVVRRFQTEP